MKPPYRPKHIKRSHARLYETASITEVLTTLGQKLGLSEKVQEWAVLALWQDVVDPPFQHTTTAHRIVERQGKPILQVKATTSTVAAELIFSLETYRTRLNAYRAETGVELHRIEILR